MKLGRAAGFAYLSIFVTGIAWYAPMQGFRGGGDGAVLDQIRAGRLLLEVSILSGAASFALYLVMAALLYRRFRAEAAVAVTLLFAFVVGSVSFSLGAVSRQMELLALLDAKGLAAPELQAQAGVLLRGFDAAGRLSSLFWGLWLLPLAWIAVRRGGWGRAAGAFVALGGLGYMLGFVKPVLWPGAATGPLDLALGGATVLSELVITLWLLLSADRVEAPASPSSSRLSRGPLHTEGPEGAQRS